MTYEESREIEQKTNEERTARHIALIQAVPGFIPGWTWQKSDHNPLGYIVNANLGAKLWINTLWNKKEQLTISSDFPKDSQGGNYMRYGVSRPFISVTSNKTAKQIADDIERRLLPKYLPLLAQVQERIAGTEAYLNGKVFLGKAIKEAFPVLHLCDGITKTEERNYNRTQQVTLNAPYEGHKHIEVTCGDKTVDLKVEGLTLAQVNKVLLLVLGMAKD